MSRAIIAHGRGTGGDASNTNGGGYDDSQRTWAEFQGTNGGPIDTATTATVTDNGSGYVRVTSAGNFSNSLVGVYVYCDFLSAHTDGHYIITAVDGSGNYIDIDLAYISDETCDCNVGGALSDLHYAMTLCENDSVVKFTTGTYTDLSSSSYLLECSFAVTGASNAELLQNSIRVMAVDEATGEPDYDNPAILDGQSGSSAGVYTLSYYQFFNIWTKDTSGNCWTISGGPDHMYFCHCGATGAGTAGFTGDDNCTYDGCWAYENTSYGIQCDNYCTAIGCYVHDNGNVGIDSDGGCKYLRNCVFDNAVGQIQGNYGDFIRNIVWDSKHTGVFGLYFDEQNPYPMIIDGNVVDMRSGVSNVGILCFQVVAPGQATMFTNNVIMNCPIGISCGYDVKGKFIFDSNLFYNNTLDISTNADGYQINEITSDPLFTDQSNGNYTLQSGSPLLAQAISFAVPGALTSYKTAIGYYDLSASSGGSSTSRGSLRLGL